MGDLAATPTRNAPCPCGSGRKYKQCCMHAEADPAAHMDLRGAGVASFAALVVCIVIGFFAGTDYGLGAAGVAVLGIGAWLVIRHPPPPRSGGDHPASINFGG